MNITLHHKQSNKLIAIYNSVLLTSLYSDLQNSSIIRTGDPEYQPNYDLNFAGEKSPPSTKSDYTILSKDSKAFDKLKPCLKVFAFEENRSFMKTLSFSDLMNIYEKEQDNLNIKDFPAFYDLIVSCSSMAVIVSCSSTAVKSSSNDLREKCYCELDFNEQKMYFYYCPMEGIKILLLSLSLDTELSPSKAYVTVLTDMYEYTKEKEESSVKYKKNLDDSLKFGEEALRKYENLVDKVEIRETQIFMQFVLLLNEKKKKIRELTAELQELKKS